MNRNDVFDFGYAADLFSKAVALYGEIEGMKAENAHRESCGLSVAYCLEAFEEAVERYGLKVPPKPPLAHAAPAKGE